MRDVKERLTRNNPQSGEMVRSPNFLIHRLYPERNRSQNLRRLRFDTETQQYGDYLPATMGVHDREKLQQNILALKTEVNTLTNQNTKLRSKIMILEKQAEKLRTAVENKYDNYSKEPKDLQRLCNTLKDRLRQKNAEYEYLDSQHQTLKKSIKKTRINELEVENQNLLIEMQRIAKLYLQTSGFKEQAEMDREELKRAVEALKERNNYAKMMEQEITKLQKNQKDLQNQLQEVKKKLELADKKRISQTNELKRIIKNIGNTAGSADAYVPSGMFKAKISQKLPQKKKTEQSAVDISKRNQSKDISKKESQRQSQQRESKEMQEAQPPLTQPILQELSKPQPPKQKTIISNVNLNSTDKHELKNDIKAEQDEYDSQPFDEQEEPEDNSVDDIIEFIIYRLQDKKINKKKLAAHINTCNARTLQQFIAFLQQEPFNIKNAQDAEIVLSSLLGKSSFNLKIIKDKLNGLFPQYKIWTKQEEQQLEKNIAEIIKNNALEMNKALSKYEDEKHMVSHEVLMKVLSSLEMTEEEIEYLLSKLSAYSPDINHMNYKEISQIFQEKQNIAQVSEYLNEDDQFQKDT